MRYKILYILVLMVLHWSCEESSVDQDLNRLGLDYYPTEVGSYRIYDVSETTYALVGPESSTYQLRESVVDSILDSATGEVFYTIHRETRTDNAQTWRLDSIWTLRIDKQRAILVENNVPFIKLVFPIDNQLEWDGNAFNNRELDFYRYENNLSDTVLNEETFSKLWTVVQSDFGQDILGRNERYEVYAPNIGMIIKNSIIWNFCQTDCSDDNQVVAGRELSQTIIAYGKEE